MFLFVFWLRKRPSINYVSNWGNGGGGSSKMCTGVYRGRGVLRLMCTYALTLSLFMTFIRTVTIAVVILLEYFHFAFA